MPATPLVEFAKLLQDRGEEIVAMIKQASTFAPDVQERMRALQNEEVPAEKR